MRKLQIKKLKREECGFADVFHEMMVPWSVTVYATKFLLHVLSKKNLSEKNIVNFF